MNDFCNAYNLSSLIKEPTCHKNLNNMSCIDLILTNSACNFQGSCVMETGLSDFHRIIVTIMKITFERLPPKIRTYRNYNKFYNHKFRETLLKELSLTNTWNNSISNFIDISMRSLEKHAPLIKKYICGNHLRFMDKKSPKAIMHRSKLCNNFLRQRCNQNRQKYLKQQNCCVSLLRRIKKNYYSNLSEKIITGNKKFWKIVTPFLLDKVLSNERITLTENDKIINNDNETPI